MIRIVSGAAVLGQKSLQKTAPVSCAQTNATEAKMLILIEKLTKEIGKGAAPHLERTCLQQIARIFQRYIVRVNP